MHIKLITCGSSTIIKNIFLVINKRLLLSLILMATTLASFGQTLQGRFCDKDGAPMEFVNVVALQPEDSTFVQGTVTAADGRFSMSGLPEGNYLLRATSVGYAMFCRLCHTGDLGTMTMQTDDVMLQEAVVTARRPTYKMKGNALVADVQNTLLSNAGTASDVLGLIPFVQGSEGNFTVFGKGSPIIYLNGRRLYDTSELTRLESKDISQVEVITNPGSEYDVTVRAVIKIKTVKPHGEGLSVNTYGGIKQNHHFSHYENLGLNYRHGGLDLFGSIYYSRSQSYQKQRDKHYISTPDTIWNHRSQIEMNYANHYLEATGGVNYMVNDKHSLGMRYTYTRTPMGRNRMNSVYDIDANDDFYDHQQYDHDWRDNDYSHHLNTYYLGNVGKLGINFNADYYETTSIQLQKINEDSQEHDDRVVTTSNISDSRLYAAKLVLSHQLGKGELRGGGEYSYTRRNNTYHNEQDYLPETDNRIEEEHIAAFAEYGITLGKLQANAGLRYEHIVSDYYDHGVRQAGQSRDYDNLFPSLSLSMPIGNVNLSLSYTAKTRRPSYNELSSNLQYDDRFTYEGGNPNLKSETIHDLTLMGSYSWLQWMLSYQHTADAIQLVGIPYEQNPAITIFTRQNFDHVDMLSAGVVLSPKWGCYEPQLSLQIQKQILKYQNLGETKHFNRPLPYAQLINGFRFSHGWKALLTLSWQGKGNESITMVKQWAAADVSVVKSFLKDRLTVNLDVKDIFASRRNSATIYGTAMVFDKWNYSDSRMLRLHISYRFNTTRSKYRGTGAANDELNRL